MIKIQILFIFHNLTFVTGKSTYFSTLYKNRMRWSNLVVHKSNSYDLKRHTWQQRVSRPWTSKCDFWHSNTQQIAKPLSRLLPLLPLSPDNKNISETWQRIFIFFRKIMVFKYLIGLILTVVGLIANITYHTVTGHEILCSTHWLKYILYPVINDSYRIHQWIGMIERNN